LQETLKLAAQRVIAAQPETTLRRTKRLLRITRQPLLQLPVQDNSLLPQHKQLEQRKEHNHSNNLLGQDRQLEEDKQPGQDNNLLEQQRKEHSLLNKPTLPGSLIR
jgi:hypothetical protein